MAKKIERTGFNVGQLSVPGVIEITLEISDDEKFQKRMEEINATLRFKHKIHNPEWSIKRVGEGSPTAILKSQQKEN
jgi:phosphoribosylformylglycinamidine (FGAM) synthase PurS component